MPLRTGLPGLRWIICALLLLASTINYVDRQTVSVLKPYLQDLFHWSESGYGWIVFGFTAAYGIMMAVSGLVIDRIGTRRGFALCITWWSIAAMGHALARGTLSFGIARFLLGAGEAGNFPASIKAVAEWFPAKERALATGIFNAGTNIGPAIAPPLVVWLTLMWGWQATFLVTGTMGLAWLSLWLIIYRAPREHPWATREEIRYIEKDEPPELPKTKRVWLSFLQNRRAWAFIFGKFLSDPAWWFYIYWLPSYLRSARGFSMKEIGYFAWIPFCTAGLGSVFGGWLSGSLIRHGWSVNAARKTALASCALCMPFGTLAVFQRSPIACLALISIATSAQQGWSANLFTLVSDMFPKKDVGTVVGLGGAGGAISGMIFALIAGYSLQSSHSYVLLFIIAGSLHPIALLCIHLWAPQICMTKIATEIRST